MLDDAVLTITTDPVNETIDFSGTDSDDILRVVRVMTF